MRDGDARATAARVAGVTCVAGVAGVAGVGRACGAAGRRVIVPGPEGVGAWAIFHLLPWNFPHALGLDEPDEPDLVNRIGCTLAAVFRLTVDDVFSIRGRGTVVTGTVELGTIRVGDTVQVNAGPPVRVDGIEAFRKRLDEAQEGQVVGLLLTSLGKHDVNSGDVISG